MLYLFFGNDVVRVRQKAFAYAEKQGTGLGETTHISAENYVPGMMAELTGGSSLFGGTSLIILDTLSDESDIYEDILVHIGDMASSPNIFVVIEKALTAPEKKKWEKHAAVVEEYKGEAKERFNTFSLTDALLRRDKKSLWLLFLEARKEGIQPEEIIGVLLWQLKVLRLVAKTKTPEEAGQKPFVYQKAQRALGLFKEGELDRLSRDLLRAYHDSHLGLCDGALAVERWILQL